jgi:transposase
LVASRPPRTGPRLVEAILTALDEQSVTVPGTTAAETVLPRLADSLRHVLTQRDQVAAEVERILDVYPLASVLTSMPGIGVRTGTRILLEVGNASTFATSGHLAAYAGLAPVTRRSGTAAAVGEARNAP